MLTRILGNRWIDPAVASLNPVPANTAWLDVTGGGTLEFDLFDDDAPPYTGTLVFNNGDEIAISETGAATISETIPATATKVWFEDLSGTWSAEYITGNITGGGGWAYWPFGYLQLTGIDAIVLDMTGITVSGEITDCLSLADITITHAATSTVTGCTGLRGGSFVFAPDQGANLLANWINNTLTTAQVDALLEDVDSEVWGGGGTQELRLTGNDSPTENATFDSVEIKMDIFTYD